VTLLLVVAVFSMFGFLMDVRLFSLTYQDDGRGQSLPETTLG